MGRNGRDVFAENMRAGQESRATYWIVPLKWLQRAQHSIAYILNFDMAFDDFNIAAADIRNSVS
jgi:hypothetical protein